MKSTDNYHGKLFNKGNSVCVSLRTEFNCVDAVTRNSQKSKYCHYALDIFCIALCKIIRSHESVKFLLVESRNPANDWSPESKFHGQRNPESITWNPESTAWNPESKTVLDSLTRDDL